MSFKPKHIHYLLRAKVLLTPVDPEVGKQMLLDLVENVKMKPVTEPQCVYVSDEGNEGLTGSINLATSHIAFHIWDVKGLLMLDVYSCTDFKPAQVIEIIGKYMQLKQISAKTINREEFLPF